MGVAFNSAEFEGLEFAPGAALTSLHTSTKTAPGVAAASAFLPGGHSASIREVHTTPSTGAQVDFLKGPEGAEITAVSASATTAAKLAAKLNPSVKEQVGAVGQAVKAYIHNMQPNVIEDKQEHGGHISSAQKAALDAAGGVAHHLSGQQHSSHAHRVTSAQGHSGPKGPTR